MRTDAEAATGKSRRYVAELASSEAAIRETQALRFRVFGQEMGAHLHSRVAGLDYDELDDYCDHLLVRESISGNVVACTRLLTDAGAARFGRFYSEGEFDLGGVLAMPGRFLEIGRTCVSPEHRGSVVMSNLWSGLAEYVFAGGFNYLMGCASITPGIHGFAVDAVIRQLTLEQIGPRHLGVRSLRPVPESLRCAHDESGIPPLLQAYLRLGCQVFGDPYWDEDFQVMDLFILLNLSQMQSRYEKRFIASQKSERYGKYPTLA